MTLRYLKSANIYLIGQGLIMNCLRDISFLISRYADVDARITT